MGVCPPDVRATKPKPPPLSMSIRKWWVVHSDERVIHMICSDERKLSLSGWLKTNAFQEYCEPFKLQKFLFFNEASAKADNLPFDFSQLRGYQRGPVFTNVWKDYTKERPEFDAASNRAFSVHPEYIDEEKAKRVAFIVKTLSEAELSELTHHMNIWNSKKDRIMNGELQVTLEEKDFNDADRILVQQLINRYPLSLIDDSDVIHLNNKYFVFSKSDIPKLEEQHYNVLAMLSEKEELHNPVFVEIDNEGRLIVD